MALGQIKGIVRTLGEERALAILQQALEIEEQGGLMLPDGSRRHHQVGFSFGTSPDEQKQIWAFKPRAKTAQKTGQASTG